MAKESPFSKEIADEWERLLKIAWAAGGDREPPEEQVTGWNALQAKTYRNGHWLIGANDAGLVASMGVTIALQQYRFQDAAQLAKSYLDHPEAAAGDRINWDHHAIHYGLGLILSGQLEDGLAVLNGVLGDRKGSRERRCMVRDALIHGLRDLGSDQAPHPLLAAFTGRLLLAFPDQKRNAARAPIAQSHAELLELLEWTFAKRKPTQEG